VTAILFIAGMTKGVLGIGLPIVAVPLLATVVPLPVAVTLLAFRSWSPISRRRSSVPLRRSLPDPWPGQISTR
jgi:hypothetical protein